MRTHDAALTLAPGGSIPTGTERSFANVTIRGAGSTWLLEPRSLDNLSASLTTGNGPNAWATVNISEGGKLRMEGAAGFYNSINLTNGYGRTDFTVTGPGSRVEMTGGNPLLNVGNSLGTANLQVLSGAVLDGPLLLNVGRDGSNGRLTVDGAASRVNLYGLGAAGTSDASGAARLQIGLNGTGTVAVSNGGRIDIAATGATTRGPQLLLGVQAASSGTLNIGGANSVVSLTSQSVLAGGGAGEAFNPFASVGLDGSGTLNLSAGGKLLLEGNAYSTTSAARGTSFYVGGRNFAAASGNGSASLTGAGSEIRISGADAFAGIGWGGTASGRLTIADNAVLSSTALSVAGLGGTGVLRVDNAQVNLTGQFIGGALVGAGFTIGDGSGSVGAVTLQNGARINIANTGSAPTGVSIGARGCAPAATARSTCPVGRCCA